MVVNKQSQVRDSCKPTACNLRLVKVLYQIYWLSLCRFSAVIKMRKFLKQAEERQYGGQQGERDAGRGRRRGVACVVTVLVPGRDGRVV